MKHIYLAGPFFDDEQIDRLERLEAALEANPTVAGFFSPFRHQYDAYEFGSKEWGDVVFESDRSQLHDADVVVAMADFYGDDDVDPGTAWEIGYAGAQEASHYPEGKARSLEYHDVSPWSCVCDKSC